MRPTNTPYVFRFRSTGYVYNDDPESMTPQDKESYEKWIPPELGEYGSLTGGGGGEVMAKIPIPSKIQTTARRVEWPIPPKDQSFIVIIIILISLFLVARYL
jgi:hypothetical protein